MGSILAATALNIAAVVLIVMFPTSPWGWTLGAAVVSLGPASPADKLPADCPQALVVQQLVRTASGAMIMTSTCVALVQVALLLWPLGPQPGPLGKAYTAFCCREAPSYFNLNIVTEEGASFDKDKPYIVGELCSWSTVCFMLLRLWSTGAIWAPLKLLCWARPAAAPPPTRH